MACNPTKCVASSRRSHPDGTCCRKNRKNDVLKSELKGMTMRQELDDLLCQRYPELFRDRHADPAQTSMCWGFCCGDGWFGIIDSLCAQIAAKVQDGQMPHVVVSQVKE